MSDRTTCPFCDRAVVRRKNGALRRHRSQDGGRCLGSGGEPGVVTVFRAEHGGFDGHCMRCGDYGPTNDPAAYMRTHSY